MPETRFASQGLSGSDLRSPAEVTGRLLAIQAQDLRGARLAVRSRLADTVGSPAASQVDQDLNQGTMVVGWLNRGTLHMVRSEDYGWLHAITGPRQVTANRTRLRQEGVSEAQAEKGVQLIGKTLADGPALRNDLKAILESAGIPVAGQAMVHILYLASILGLIVRGPMIGGEQGFVLVRDWLGEPVAFDPETYLPELARRYLAGHGPAGDRDLAAWAGIPIGQARKGLDGIAGETVEAGGLVDLKDRPKTRPASPIRLLGPFDPVLHGWASRDWLIPDAQGRGVVTTNGIFRPSILIGDRIGGTWAMPAGKIELKPFGRLAAPVVKELHAEEERVREYLER